MGSAVITAEAAAALRRHARDAYPDEGCGVLVGRSGSDGGVEVVEVSRGRNLVTDRSRDRYELDPGAIVSAERSARASGLDVVGFWHTHPDHPARPSGFDTERAWPDYLYVICAVTEAGVEAVRGFRLARDGGPFAEVDLVEAPATPSRLGAH
jgi:proteasome lid subunit RPN8/RPN11